MAGDERRKLVEIEEARRRVLAAVSALASATVPLGAAALGRVLAEEITASEPVPAFENSAMDGFAVRAEDLLGVTAAREMVLRVIDESRAGSPASHALASGEAISVSIGPMLLDGAEEIVRLEDIRRDGELLAAEEMRPVRCRLSAREDGLHAEPTGAHGSHILTSMLGADALAIAPSEVAAVRAGERVEIELLARWLGVAG